MKIFDVDDSGKVTLDPEVRTIKWIKRIVERDRGGTIKGDHDGRKKYKALRELAYIYFMCDSKSIYQRIPEAEREQTIIEDLDFDGKWTPDEVIKEAMEKYKSLKETVSERTLKELKRTLESSVDTLQFIRESIEGMVKAIKDDKDTSKLPDLIKLYSTAISMAEDLPKSIENITKLEEKVKKEIQSSSSSIRGAGTIGDYE